MISARRLCDVVLAGTALGAAAMPLALCALAIKLTSRGPILYRQVRIGRGGQPFCFYKLRTMAVDAADGPQVTAIDDRRVTPVGRLLRRAKLDELPQLWHVVTGEMAIIGPRPEVPRFVDRYTETERAILAAPPGLASAAQLVFAGEADLLKGVPDPEAVYVNQLMPLKIRIDLEYERTRTMASDLRLMAQLVLAVFGWRLRPPACYSVPPISHHG